jgi:hypothetical protein
MESSMGNCFWNCGRRSSVHINLFHNSLFLKFPYSYFGGLCTVNTMLSSSVQFNGKCGVPCREIKIYIESRRFTTTNDCRDDTLQRISLSFCLSHCLCGTTTQPRGTSHFRVFVSFFLKHLVKTPWTGDRPIPRPVPKRDNTYAGRKRTGFVPTIQVFQRCTLLRMRGRRNVHSSYLICQGSVVGGLRAGRTSVRILAGDFLFSKSSQTGSGARPAST